jgi:predicted methyltransferase
MEKLDDIRDIRPVFELADYTLYILGVVVAAAVLSALAVVLYRLFFQKNRADLRGEAIRTLQALDLEESKSAAYAITELVRRIAATEREEKMADKLIEKLEPYKYLKEVPPLSEDVRAHLNIFLGMVHE